MSLPIEEVDNNGNAIFFKSPADISKSAFFDNYDINSQERVNELYVQNRLPAPKFRGFVFNYSAFLALFSRGQAGQHRVKQQINYQRIKAIYSSEHDPSVVFMIIEHSKGQSQVRVFRLPNIIAGTKFRYVIDQLQLNPMHESDFFKQGTFRRTVNSGSSFSTPQTEESEVSATSATHNVYKSAAHNPTMRTFYKEDEEPKLPRVQPFAFSTFPTSPLYSHQRSVSRQRTNLFESFYPADYEVYRPASRRSRINRYDNDYTGSRRSSRRRSSRPRMESPSLNHNSRAAVRSRMQNKNNKYADYQTNQYDYEMPQNFLTGFASRSGSVPHRYTPYYY
ncbi:unnamed protein product [Mesocestoides corti]|uniref:Velvet domain-containing protein n=1 Tax=Mesocestoides corti TaxID=53468 RepID=A0A0R3UNE5_MESCO|nr:unnamed protein product [Mesocestoides corti]